MSEIKIIGDKSTFKEPKNPWVFKPRFVYKLKMFLFYTFAAIASYLGIFLFSIIAEINLEIFIIQVITGVFIVISLIVFIMLSKYFNSFEYQVHGTEIIVRKGLFNKTENHIPFSNITNIAIRRGPFDQLLKIGSILIYTASNKNNPLNITSINGIKIYEDVGYFILGQIRNFDDFFSHLMAEKVHRSNVFSQEFWLTFQVLIKEIKGLFEIKQKE
jgi:membrane protein YdbS with pleckstrin-like domain